MVLPETNACARWSATCGESGDSGEVSCAGTGSPSLERFPHMQGECPHSTSKELLIQLRVFRFYTGEHWKALAIVQVS